ncbi:MAG: carboxypeptidase-like regulatory domain-containing protein, partial [Perlabentimonas sp.]
MKFIYLLLVILSIAVSHINAQQYVQNIRGVVIDSHTEIPLPGATVLLQSNDETEGTSTDALGNFIFENIPVGRHSIVVTFIGYKPYQLQNFTLNTGKEFILKISLEESTSEIDAVEVKYKVNKQAPLNEMALVSSRMFTIEETERYAGSVGDPARMASNFAGVNSLNDQSNTIVIGGNTPFGMLWMMEGVDIPNPTHFGGMGS